MRQDLVKKRIRPLTLGVVVGSALLALLYMDGGVAYSSVEVEFSDPSASGLSIVPASCPSRPHYAGHCSPPPPPRCPDGSLAPGGNVANCTCAQGNTAACPPLCPNGSAAPGNDPWQCSCAQGDIYMCVGTCPNGSPAPGGNPSQCTCAQGNYGVCVSHSCPDGYTWNPDVARCEAEFRLVCPLGWAWSFYGCVPPPGPAFETFNATNGDGSPFVAVAGLIAKPQLVRVGDTARVYWKATNVISCTVTSTNGDSWTSEFSGESGKVSSPLPHKTVFSLLCNGRPGALPPSLTGTQTVNMVPIFDEL